jgi:hypothetical protein
LLWPKQAGLPDGIFSNQKYQFWQFFEGLAMEDVVTFNGQLVYFMAFWYILRLFTIYFPFLVCCAKKNLANLETSVIVPSVNKVITLK